VAVINKTEIVLNKGDIDVKIGIAGIGGIGSNVARHLAQGGIKKITIVDFDCVEASNLNRQFYSYPQIGKKKTDSLEKNLKGISPEIQIKKIDKKIKPGDLKKIFPWCRIIVEGFDKKIMKKMFIEELSGANIILVSASGIAGDNMNTITIKKMGNCYIVGDFISDVDDLHLFPPKIALVASIMAGIVLKHAEI